MTFRFTVLAFCAALALLALQACSVSTPSMSGIRDSKLFDRRIKETPRQKVVREWVDEQAAQQAEVANMLKSLAETMKRGG